LEGYLSQLAARGIISYQPATSMPTLNVLTHRRRLGKEEVGWDKLEFLRLRAQERLAAMLKYISIPGKMCRSRMLEAYFGESGTNECGKCDYCVAKARANTTGQVQELSTSILAFLGSGEMEMRELIDNVPDGSREERIALVREMLDKGILKRGSGLSVRRAE
jgi:ATP-dependent DNA helicase RecQ